MATKLKWREFMFEFILILFLVVAGASYSSYKIGLREGTEKMLEVLHEQKIIKFDHKGNIVPNPFFNS